MILRNQIQAAVELGVSQSTLQKWVAMGCPHIVLNPQATGKGIRRRYDVQKVQAWLEERNKGKQEEPKKEEQE